MTSKGTGTDVELVATLPEDAVLVHIGPFKTGTTALQASLGKHRQELAAHGILYPGQRRSHHQEIWALRGHSTTGHGRVPYERWAELAREVAAHPGRSMISSEFLAGCNDRDIERLVTDLGPDRVHVLMTVRTLAPLLASDWQEKVKTHGFTDPYEMWLSDVLDPARDSESAKRFWRFYGCKQLLDRWATAIPEERIIALVSDGTQRELGMRTVESLLGLPPELLTPADPNTANASLTYDRIELLRRVNEVFARRGWPDAELRRLVHQGLLKGLAAPVDGDPGRKLPDLPQTAHARVAELSRERISALTESGAVVVGDPGRLAFRTPSEPRPGSEEVPETMGIGAAVNGIEALVEASLTHRQRLGARIKRLNEERATASVSDVDPSPPTASTASTSPRGARERLRSLLRATRR